MITDYDVYLFREGGHCKLYDKLGSHLREGGVYFAVWAPNAVYVSVVGSFNGWSRESSPMSLREDGSGIWEVFLPGAKLGDLYKYFIVSKTGYQMEKSDPFGFFFEVPPKAASIVWSMDYTWNDREWVEKRHTKNSLSSPWLIYEVHVGSWKKRGWESLSYRELAHELVNYVKDMGFTHVEFLPIMEHPFYGSWGYQTIGYFAPTSRYGTPQDFMYLVDRLHQEGIGVVLDWVPSHFPTDGHALAYFDGTHLYEYEDYRKRYHPDWNSYIFDYSKPEVRSFLLSSAHFWFEKYHIDAIRVDAVASMLYLDYSRKDGQWTPNMYGGKENLEAIDFIKKLNECIYRDFPHVQTIAEESTAWPTVTKPTYLGGLGFGMKWNMGWMHDTLYYFSKDPIYRKYHHESLTFSMWYAFSENFLLPLSHDEVVHGKGSLINKMPKDWWQKFANLRLLFTYMYAHPGKKLIFMGGEFGQWEEWNHDRGLDWFLLDWDTHRGVQRLIKDLNRAVRENPALYEMDFSWDGFEWIDFSDHEQSVISFLRKSRNNLILCVFNFTPIPRENYRMGVPKRGSWKRVINSDAKVYGGSGFGDVEDVYTEDVPFHGRPYSLTLTLPPLAGIYFRYEE
ncbi:MAG: 1,4-alpha-glucan branching protein GlgB [Aquificaceae bacterium]